MTQGIQGRLEWTDADWANYLDCPIKKIQEYKKILDENYVMLIEQDRVSGQYSFAAYKYNFAPSGIKRLQLWLTDDKHKFATATDAIHNANNIISKLELNDIWAEALNIPNRAIQMMLIRGK